MSESNVGNLSRYVRRIMKQKKLTQRDIELRSGGKITDGYVADILRGAAKNPSVEKVKALARGLAVDPHELFDIACGPVEQIEDQQPSPGLSRVVSFLEMMQEVAESRELTKIVQEAIQLWPGERAVMVETLESINERKRKPQPGKKKLRGKPKT